MPKLKNPFKSIKTRRMPQIRKILSSNEKSRIELYRKLVKGEQKILEKQLDKAIKNSFEKFIISQEKNTSTTRKSKKARKRKSKKARKSK